MLQNCFCVTIVLINRTCTTVNMFYGFFFSQVATIVTVFLIKMKAIYLN